MDKNFVVRKTIELLEQDLQSVETNIQNLHATANNAPSPMESWSDSTRRERQSMASDMENTKNALHQAILLLKNLDASLKLNTIQPGALVTINDGGKESLYLVVPFGGGKTIMNEDISVKTITVDSKIGAALMGKKQGDKTVIALSAGEKSISILNVS